MDENLSIQTGKFASLMSHHQNSQNMSQSRSLQPIESIKVKTVFYAGSNLENHKLMPLEDDLIMQDYNVINTIPKNGFQNEILSKRKNNPFKHQNASLLPSLPTFNPKNNIRQAFREEQQIKRQDFWDRSDLMSAAGNKLDDDQLNITLFTKKQDKLLGFQQDPLPTSQNLSVNKNDTSFDSFLEHEKRAALNKGNLIMKRREDLPHAEELAGDNAQKAQPLIPIFGEQTMKRFFSHNWGLRQDALKVVFDELTKDKGASKLVRQQSPDYLMLGVLGLIGFSIGDKIAQVSNLAFELLRRFDGQFFESGIKLPKSKEAEVYPQLIIEGILQKLGDNNPRMREQAQQALMQLSNQRRIFGLRVVVQNIMEIQNKKIQNSVKHLNGKARILIALLKQKQEQFKGIQYPIDGIGVFAVKLSSHQNKDLRQLSVELIASLYRVYGASLTSKFNSKLKSAQKEQVAQMIKNK